MPIQSDIPGHIARWLFRLGIIWAIVLVPLTIVLFPLGVYGLAGLAVWLGWRWRSRERPALRVAAAFWLFSAVFNVAFVVYCSRALVESYALSVQDFQLQRTPLKSISQLGISASL